MTEVKQLPKLTFNKYTPSYVRRAYRVVLNEYGVDIRHLPPEDWTPILIVACDHDKLDTFREAVIAAVKQVVERRYWWAKW
jgi:hypothetical protein